MPYVSSFGQKQLPTTTQIMQALRSANEPDLVKRDTRPLQAILGRLPEADLDIFSAIQSRKNSVMAYDWTVEAGKPRGATAAPDIEIQRAQEIASRFRRSGLHNERDTVLNARFTGDVAIDLYWSTGEGGEHIVNEYDVVDAVDLKRDASAILGYSKYVYTGDGNDAYTLQPYDLRENVILATSNPLRGIRSDFDGGLLRTVIYLTVLKYYNWYDWAKVGEKFGDPAMVARYPRMFQNKKNADGSTEADLVLEFLTSIATESGAAIPDDIKVDILDLVSKGASADLYSNFIDKVTSRQERVLLGQDVVNLAHQEGTYAQAKEAGKTTENHTWSDLLWLQNVLTDQYVISDYILNYGRPTTNLFPVFKFDTAEMTDYKTNAVIAQLLASSGYDLNPDEVREKTGFTVTKSTAQPTDFGV